ncbi:MAG: NAD(P)H-binding protein [Bacteroidota bacterium]
MNILLLGATGRTGKLVLQEALEQGHRVHCLARKSSRIAKQEGLSIFEGNAHDTADLDKAIQNCQAVISVLNISRSSDFPWSSLRTPPHYMSEVMSRLIPIAKKQDIKRISLCSAWGVAETKEDIPIWFKWMIDYSNIGPAYKDHERQERMLEESKLDWTIVRPVGLSNVKSQESIKESLNNHPKPSLLISRKSLAKYLVASLENEELIHKKIVISKA